MKKSTRIISGLLALCLTATLAGCGGEKQPGPSAAGNSGGEAAAPDYYKIAVTGPMTGNNAENGKNFDVAVDIAVEEINAAGGINGVPLKKETYDSKADPKESVDIARRLVEDGETLAVIGDFSSSSCMAAAPVFEEGKLLQLSPSATHTDYAGMGDYQFGIMGRQDGEAPFYADIIMDKYIGTKKVGIIYLNNDWGLSVLENMENSFAENGIEVTAKEMFADSDTDFSSSLNKIRQSDPDTICLVSFYQHAGIMVKQIRQMGWDVNIVSMGIGFSSIFSELVGEDGEGVYSGSMFVLDLEQEKDKAYNDEFTKRSGGLAPTVLGVCAYDATYMLAQAMKNALAKGELTRETLRDELAGLNDFVGMTGPIKFNDIGDVTRKYRVCQIINNEWTVLTDYDYY